MPKALRQFKVGPVLKIYDSVYKQAESMVRTYVYIFIFMTIDCTESGKKQFVCENKISTVKLLYFNDKSLT